MSRTDLISDALTIIRNAYQVHKEESIIPYSKMLVGILDILKREGFIENFKVMEMGNTKSIKVYLKYDGKKKAISNIKKISKPGRRIYVSKDEIPEVLSGYGIAVMSTSHGIITNKEARKIGVGGEVICYVW